MTTDMSAILCQKYVQQRIRHIAVTLKNGEILQRQLAGFYENDLKWDEPYVRAWHSAPTADALGLGVDDEANQLQQVIAQHN